MPSMKGKTGTLHRPDLGAVHMESVQKQHLLAQLRQEIRGIRSALGVDQATYNAPRIGAGQAFMETQFPGLPGMDLIADLVLPMFPSQVKAANYPKITRESILSTPDAKRSSKSGYNRVNFGAEDGSFSCEEFGLEAQLGDDERALYVNDFDAEAVSISFVRGLLALAREIRVAALVFNTTTWAGASLYTDYSSSGPWATVATDIIAQIVAARNASRALTGVEPDTLIVGPTNLGNLIANTGIKAKFPGAAVVSEEMIRQNLAAVLGISKLYVGKAVKNTKPTGATAFSGSDVWTGYAMVCKTPSMANSLAEPCVGRSILWAADSPSEPVIEQYREEATRSDVFRVRHSLDEIVIDASFGHLLKTVA